MDLKKLPNGDIQNTVTRIVPQSELLSQKAKCLARIEGDQATITVIDAMLEAE